MAANPINVLILCTGNSARSILGEALFTHESGGKYRGFSAGSQPTGTPNPFALETLSRHGIAIDARSKSWDEFAAPGAPEMDYIFTVCDSAAGETCPFWPGHPVSAHWGLPDPAATAGSDDDKRAAFEEAFGLIRARVRAFLALPLDEMAPEARVKALAEIGQRTEFQG